MCTSHHGREECPPRRGSQHTPGLSPLWRVWRASWWGLRPTPSRQPMHPACRGVTICWAPTMGWGGESVGGEGCLPCPQPGPRIAQSVYEVRVCYQNRSVFGAFLCAGAGQVAPDTASPSRAHHGALLLRSAAHGLAF